VFEWFIEKTIKKLIIIMNTDIVAIVFFGFASLLAFFFVFRMTETTTLKKDKTKKKIKYLTNVIEDLSNKKKTDGCTFNHNGAILTETSVENTGSDMGILMRYMMKTNGHISPVFVSDRPGHYAIPLTDYETPRKPIYDKMSDAEDEAILSHFLMVKAQNDYERDRLDALKKNLPFINSCIDKLSSDLKKGSTCRENTQIKQENANNTTPPIKPENNNELYSTGQKMPGVPPIKN